MFRIVYKRGRSIANRVFVMYILKNEEQKNRLGVTVSKKVGCAVVRNRVRRRARESCRLMQGGLNEGFDIVVIARVSAKDASYRDIDSALKDLFKKHGLYT